MLSVLQSYEKSVKVGNRSISPSIKGFDYTSSGMASSSRCGALVAGLILIGISFLLMKVFDLLA